MADLKSLPKLPNILPPRVIHDKVHNARLTLGLPNAPDDSNVVDLIAGANTWLGNPFGIPWNSAINPILDLLNSGIFIGFLFF